MPYDGEFAKHGILMDFAENELIKEMLANCEIRENEVVLPPTLINVERANWKPGQVFAIDGSNRPVPVTNGYPGASAGFVSIATVMIDMEKLYKETSAESINPVTFSDIEKAYAMTGVLPTSNILRKGLPDARTSFRYELHELLRTRNPIKDGESLLDTYLAVLALKPASDRLSCPLMDICDDKTQTPNLPSGVCACGKYKVYPTDQLRIHERYYDNSPNGESVGETRSLMEHLTLLNYLRYIEKKEYWGAFKDTGFILDGPLAVFGHAAWFGERIKLELQRLNKLAQKHVKQDMLVIGIEKTGQFFEHWLHLDEARRKNVVSRKMNFGEPDVYDKKMDWADDELDPLERLRGRIQPGQVLLLDNKYIRQNIARGDESTIHGIHSYYGRPFLYKTMNSAMIVGMVPMASEHCEDRTQALADQYPRLPDVLDLLDGLISMRYPDAVLPLLAAHAHAAIPVQMGDRMFEQLVREHLDRPI
ncbi:hypothetical protein [Deinococcus frigens]|uniref:hypothetical protein n=1 Tax=Deinococcus frigens TaxID=249403 RepID=UPI000B0683E3|nr:hypothetical protein [Deinococcus frigens]